MIVQNSKKVPTFRSRENVQKHFFVSGYLSCNPRLKKLRWPVRIVKLRKGQKYSKILKTIANFMKILLKFVILLSSEHHSIVPRDYPGY